MNVHPDILSAIGNTPLVKLNKVVGKNSAAVYAKCEFMNPTGSTKDRIALHIVNEAEKAGILKPGGTIVENTSGNTGLGLAMVGAVKGYRCVFTMPDKMSVEKINMLKSFGAEVVITPTNVPGDSPEHYVNVAKRIATETPNGFYVNQYHSKQNIEAHYLSTGPEVWDQMDGKIDAFVAGVGTGGTISGAGKFLKEKSKSVKVIGVDPIGSIHYHYFHTKTMPTPHVYKVEGIGEDILCDATEYEYLDDVRQITDRESFVMARRLVREEGLFCGGSSGSTVHIAVQVARELGPGKNVVVILCDSATRYITKYLADSWMKDYGFLDGTPDLGFVDEIISSRKQKLFTAKAEEPLAVAIERMRKENVSQLPILDAKGMPEKVVHEVDILRALHEGKVDLTSPVKDVATPAGGLIFPKARIEELYRIFDTDQVALVVDEEKLIGVISKIDLIEFLSRKGA